jgi:hypothetical protein
MAKQNGWTALFDLIDDARPAIQSLYGKVLEKIPDSLDSSQLACGSMPTEICI